MNIMSLELLWLLVPAALFPLLIKFVFIHAVYYLVRRKEYPFVHELVHSGWEDEQTVVLMKKVHIFAKSRVSGVLPPKFEIESDIKAILLLVQQHLSKKNRDDDKLKFTFTPEHLIQCFLLLISDTYREFADSWWIKRVLNLRLIWFRRGRGIKNLYDRISSIPLFHWLISLRTAGPILRALLIPVIGPPLLIFYLIRVFSIQFLWEGIIRYLYSVVLVRVAYYTVFLYSAKNDIISKRLSQFGRKKAAEYWQAADSFLNPGKWESKSENYPAAALDYLNYLREIVQPPDKLILGKDESIGDFHAAARKVHAFFRAAFSSSKRAFKKQIDQYTHPEYSEYFKQMAHIIGSRYYPQSPFMQLSLHDLLLCSYFGSLYMLGYIYKAPGTSPLLRSVSVDVLFKIKEIAETDMFQYLLRGFKYSGKVGSILFQTRKGYQLLRGGGGGISLMLSAGPPIVYQYIEDGFIAFLFHRWGRLLLRLFEESKKSQGKKEDLRNIL